jgi:hypothetical protein
VTLIPPAHVKPYVRRNKSDQVDAAAINEAMSRPGRRFVPVRSIDNQAELMRHRARELLAGQRTAALNALRGHLAEIGLIAPQGAQHAYGLKRMAVDGFNENGEIVVPAIAPAEAVQPLVAVEAAFAVAPPPFPPCRRHHLLRFRLWRSWRNSRRLPERFRTLYRKWRLRNARRPLNRLLTDLAEGGTFAVPETINNQRTLKFVVGDGASDVSVPIDVVSNACTHRDDYRSRFFLVDL